MQLDHVTCPPTRNSIPVLHHVDRRRESGQPPKKKPRVARAVLTGQKKPRDKQQRNNSKSDCHKDSWKQKSHDKKRKSNEPSVRMRKRQPRKVSPPREPVVDVTALKEDLAEMLKRERRFVRKEVEQVMRKQFVGVIRQSLGPEAAAKLAKDTLLCWICGEQGHVAAGCKRGSRKRRLCYRCGQPGHASAVCTGKDIRMCYHCHQNGHVGAKCPQLTPAQAQRRATAVRQSALSIGPKPMPAAVVKKRIAVKQFAKRHSAAGAKSVDTAACAAAAAAP